ncbi:M16 family metallopeptidase [Sphingosinicella sp.]|uniref:M16 family metallopeptidase n=1 Tax=Sphingosinicella sp. TaxID=1917971 RepID=UPI004037974C
MTFLRALLLAVSLLVAPPLLAQTGDADWLYRGSDIARDPGWRFGTLPNGLRYAVRRNALPAGQVSIRVRIDAGSLHEADNERGWAHYVEHMLFRGTENFPDRRAREIWAELGASFGSDTNATTDSTETVYQLDLPHADRANLDRSLEVLAEMMTRARFEAAAVAAERPVILSEKNRRPELTQRFFETSWPLVYAGLRYAERDPIGTEATLNGATAEGLRGFYRRWYRPERATVILVGDADPAMLEELVRSRFGGWQGEGSNPADPDPGRPTEPASPVAALAYPGVPVTATATWVRPYEAAPHTIARERQFLEEMLAARIVNRRLEAHARGESAFIAASIAPTRQRAAANMTSLSVTARDGRWREGLTEAFAIIGDALRAPPSTAEIDRELRNIRTSAAAAVQGEATALSQLHAERLASAIDNNAVVATAQTTLDNFERIAPEMTPERIAAALQSLFTGSGPRLLVTAPEAIAGGATALAEGLATARAAAPATRAAERRVSFDDLPALGRPGREVSRRTIADMGVTIVRFANGATLTHKRTEFDRSAVAVQLRFGRGIAGISPNGANYGWMSPLVAPSGLAGLDLDGMERLLTGRRIGMSFSIDEDAFVLGGQTSVADLPDQLRLLATKLVHPRWDPALLARFRSSALDGYDLQFASASARAGRELGSVIRPGDARWRPVERTDIEAATAETFQRAYAPLLAQGPVHAIIVGDVDLETAVAAMRQTVAALPRRPERDRAIYPPRPPAPNPEPVRFTHRGDPNQAYALIGWTTLGGRDRTRERRALSLAGNILQARLFDRLREEEGATYAPSAAYLGAESFPDWGIVFVTAEIRPERAETFFRVAREIVADLAARPASAEEFARAQNPVISGIERRLATNGYWLQALENWERDERDIANVRSYLADYRALTPEDVRRAVATWVTDQGDWSMLVLPAREQAATRE